MALKTFEFSGHGEKKDPPFPKNRKGQARSYYYFRVTYGNGILSWDIQERQRKSGVGPEEIGREESPTLS
jgi:hypothetical protein